MPRMVYRLRVPTGSAFRRRWDRRRICLRQRSWLRMTTGVLDVRAVAGLEKLARERLYGEHIEVVVRHGSPRARTGASFMNARGAPPSRAPRVSLRPLAGPLSVCSMRTKAARFQTVPQSIAQRRVVGIRQHLESRRRRAAVVDGDQRFLPVERERPPERLIDEPERDRGRQQRPRRASARRRRWRCGASRGSARRPGCPDTCVGFPWRVRAAFMPVLARADSPRPTLWAEAALLRVARGLKPAPDPVPLFTL